MLVEKSGVSFAEDALSSSYYTTSGSTGSINADCSGSLNSSTTSMSSSTSQHRRGFLAFLDWFKFGVSEEKKQDKDTVDEIMKCFKKNDVDGIEKFILPDISLQSPDEDDFWWDDGDVHPTPTIAAKPIPKATPHVKKFLSQLPPKVRKAVRFELDYTPEEKSDRPFTPLFTSTPKQGDGCEDSDDEDLPPLRDVDSNTVVNPLNNTSSILLANNSVMDAWNKSREETCNALFIAKSEQNYKIYYDDTDEEEVVENHSPVEETPSRRTFVVSSESSSEIKTVQEESYEDDHDTSTDSSVILGLDRIEDYIQTLEDVITTAGRVGREQDVARARGAVFHAKFIQEKIAELHQKINEMCGKMERLSGEDKNASGVSQNYSKVLQDSFWAQIAKAAENQSFENISYDVYRDLGESSQSQQMINEMLAKIENLSIEDKEPDDSRQNYSEVYQDSFWAHLAQTSENSYGYQNLEDSSFGGYQGLGDESQSQEKIDEIPAEIEKLIDEDKKADERQNYSEVLQDSFWAQLALDEGSSFGGYQDVADLSLDGYQL